jgi:tRNA(Ile2) C34 agmatinyltransferase TiaS
MKPPLTCPDCGWQMYRVPASDKGEKPGWYCTRCGAYLPPEADEPEHVDNAKVPRRAAT